MQLDHKTILLTGASGGIGSALAMALAEQGATLLLQGRRHDELERLHQGLPGADRHQCLVAELTQAGDRARLTQAVRQAGGLDVLINNAGVSGFGWLADQSPAQVSELLGINLEAPILLTQALLPLLRRPGLVMNMGSAFGGIGYPGYSAYCASKFALRGFSEALGRELAGTGIQVLHFAPRATRTRINPEAVYAMNARLGNRTDSPERVAALAVRALERESRRRWLGWPEKLLVRLNSLCPRLLDLALARQIALIARYAGHTDQKESES